MRVQVSKINFYKKIGILLHYLEAGRWVLDIDLWSRRISIVKRGKLN